MGANKNNQKEEKKDFRGKIARIDLYIIFLFAVQVAIYFTKSVSQEFALADLISSQTNFNLTIFALYCLSFFILFINLFYLFLAYKKRDDGEKELYLSTAFIGTILFFIINFTMEIFILRLKQPLF